MGLFDALKTAFTGPAPVGNGYNQPPYYNQGLPEEQVRVMDLLRRHPTATDEQLNHDAFEDKMSLAGVHQWREKAEAALKHFYGDITVQPITVNIPAPKGQ